MRLSTVSNFRDADSAYRAIVDAHRGLGAADSADLDAALVLILANHIGDADVLAQAIALAKRTIAGDAMSRASSFWAAAPPVADLDG